MFGSLGFAEIMVVVIVALVFIGPDQLPKVAKQVGKALADLRRTTNDLRYEFMNGLDEAQPTPPRRNPARPTVKPAANLESANTQPTDSAEDSPQSASKSVPSGPDAVDVPSDTSAETSQPAGAAPRPKGERPSPRTPTSPAQPSNTEAVSQSTASPTAVETAKVSAQLTDEEAS